MANASKAPYCKRCGTFGHDTEGCEAECKRYRGRHGTKTCFRGKAYAKSYAGAVESDSSPVLEVTGGNQLSSDFPSLQEASTSGMQILKPRGLTSSSAKPSYWNGDSVTDSQSSNDTKMDPMSNVPAGKESPKL